MFNIIILKIKKIKILKNIISKRPDSFFLSTSPASQQIQLRSTLKYQCLSANI
jgi:hypothetical protein